jgi:hypothetical protein
MSSEHIVSLLIEERDRLDAAIRALQGSSPVKRAGRPRLKRAAVDGAAPAAPKKRVLSAAGRKAIAAAAKKRWALIKAGKATSPFAGRKRAAKKS